MVQRNPLRPGNQRPEAIPAATIEKLQPGGIAAGACWSLGILLSLLAPHRAELKRSWPVPKAITRDDLPERRYPSRFTLEHAIDAAFLATPDGSMAVPTPLPCDDVPTGRAIPEWLMGSPR